MTTDTDLRTRLRDLADDAPHAGLSGEDLWRSGVRRQRLRLAATVGGAAVVVALVVGLASVIRLPTSAPPPAEGPAELGIPRVVAPPDPWSGATAEPGPLAAISVANRRTTDGLTGSRDQLALFGVSAADGVSRFLDVPGTPRDVDPGAAALSPDGTRVAVTRWVPRQSGGSAVAGWDVLDATTGVLTRLRVPDMPRLRGTDVYEISFTGDGRYLLTNFSLTGGEETHDDSLVAWDVDTGERYVAEGSGHYWLPGPASGPEGVVWTRGRDVLTFDPLTGDTVTVRVPHQLVDAAYAPDGETLAYVGHSGDRPQARGPWRLHVRVRAADGGVRTLDVGIEARHVLGWRDETHVVASSYGPRGARVVDVATGDWEPLPLSQDGDALMTPRYAADLWALPLAAAVEQPDAGDPRPWMHQEVQWIGIGLLLGGLLQVWLVLRRRRGRA